MMVFVSKTAVNIFTSETDLFEVVDPLVGRGHEVPARGVPVVSQVGLQFEAGLRLVVDAETRAATLSSAPGKTR